MKVYNVQILENNGVNINEINKYFSNMSDYNNSLNIFYKNIKSTINSLVDFYNNKLMNKYITLIISLKGECCFLCIEKLQELLNKIEHTNTNEDDFKYLHEELIDVLNNYILIFNDYFNKKETNDSEEINDNSVAEIINQNEKITPIIKPKLIKPMVLIVDDSSIIVKLISDYLSSDYDIISASNGEEAIKIMSDNNNCEKIKICLLDLNMPLVDGFDVLDFCKRNDYFNRFSIIVESGIEDISMMDKVNEYPISGILIKPFKEEDLRRVISECLL